MINYKKYSKTFFILFLLIVISLIIFVSINKFQQNKDKVNALKPITINLLTNVHPKLPWKFTAAKPKILVKPGEVVTIEYLVENLGDQETTGIATFAYYPKQFGEYIRKLNCFCYDAQSLKPNKKGKYSVILLIDPEATKDSKTKSIKEVTIQFTFFDYKEYKDSKN